MLARARGFLGLISALLVMTALLVVLLRAGWHPGDDVGAGSPLHHAYRQATTVTWVGIVACQIGTAMAVRTEHASLRGVGLFTNKPLLAALAGVYVPVVHTVLGTETLSAGQWALVAPFPFIVWGADEIRRWHRRRPGAAPISSVTGPDRVQSGSAAGVVAVPDPS
ncbi:cation-translocating P-type ATPase C-terminal domain-containing protein [Streptomyces sp. NBC_00988]|uniref:cation transporting ATPase C-terminal domain-containing protein n=1 Tax=Streptomyces sp. NBC_00988 TaxID=2903704 RepID=UPI0038637411|nr:cation-translocating P-type ATPase C-terminal domain-containing protein [Streptomyces sp. NBC_00988]